MGTGLFGVQVEVGFSSEIVPVVGINTSFLLVILFRKGAPHSFIVEEVEICVGLKLVN